jgi:hypothetical protein
LRQKRGREAKRFRIGLERGEYHPEKWNDTDHGCKYQYKVGSAFAKPLHLPF